MATLSIETICSPVLSIDGQKYAFQFPNLIPIDIVVCRIDGEMAPIDLLLIVCQHPGPNPRALGGGAADIYHVEDPIPFLLQESVDAVREVGDVVASVPRHKLIYFFEEPTG